MVKNAKHRVSVRGDFLNACVYIGIGWKDGAGEVVFGYQSYSHTN